MGKRLLRIFPAQFVEKLTQLHYAEIHLVMYSGATFRGILQKIETHQLVFRDHLGRTHTLPLNNISEITTDVMSAY